MVRYELLYIYIYIYIYGERDRESFGCLRRVAKKFWKLKQNEIKCCFFFVADCFFIDISPSQKHWEILTACQSV